MAFRRSDMVDMAAPWAFDCQIKRGAFAEQFVAMSATNLRRVLLLHEKSVLNLRPCTPRDTVVRLPRHNAGGYSAQGS
jgi:hypothetical protein